MINESNDIDKSSLWKMIQKNSLWSMVTKLHDTKIIIDSNKNIKSKKKLHLWISSTWCTTSHNGMFN